jgi:DtxR family manganese transport transcriptional regulator
LATTGEARPTDIARRRGVFLTQRGRALADRIRARHRLVVNVLLALGVPNEAAEPDAEGMEHYVSDSTLKAFAQFMQSRA